MDRRTFLATTSATLLGARFAAAAPLENEREKLLYVVALSMQAPASKRPITLPPLMLTRHHPLMPRSSIACPCPTLAMNCIILAGRPVDRAVTRPAGINT